MNNTDKFIEAFIEWLELQKAAAQRAQATEIERKSEYEFGMACGYAHVIKELRSRQLENMGVPRATA